MLKPGFLDFLLLLAIFVLTAKGYITGTFRSVVTLVALGAAMVMSGVMPLLLAQPMHYLIRYGSPNHELLNRLVLALVMFVAFQGVGFVVTGLIENIGLGVYDKLLGALLGVVAGLLTATFPAVAIYQAKGAYAHTPNRIYFRESVVIRAVHPWAKRLASNSALPRR
ncbi:MAG: CvpA family protein [Candidatus Sericytochromatia bacterium]|nr:CvpA family protein [Candidatus Sericytochromatia bacterium]